MKRQFEIPKEHREEVAALFLEAFKARCEYELRSAQMKDMLEKKDWEGFKAAINDKGSFAESFSRVQAKAWERVYELVPGVPRETVCGYAYSNITQEMEPGSLPH